jgi:hypothetical protein
MRSIIMLVWLLLAGPPSVCLGANFTGGADAGEPSPQPLVVVVPVDYPGQIGPALVVAESLRDHGDALASVPVRLYIHSGLEEAMAPYRDRAAGLGAEIRSVEVPEAALHYVLGAKPFTMARAERDAEGAFACLAVVAPNTLFLDEPADFLLAEGVALGYSTVHHRNVGSPLDEEPDPYWSRIYERLAVPAGAVFPVTTLADRQVVRFYLNAGSFVVRPQRGLLRRWAESFRLLYEDDVMAEMAAEGPRNVFLHQASLAGAALRLLRREETVELPATYSYPLFFDRFYEGDHPFDSLEGVITMRYEFQWGDLPAGWQRDVTAPAGVLAWITERCAAP